MILPRTLEITSFPLPFEPPRLFILVFVYRLTSLLFFHWFDIGTFTTLYSYADNEQLQAIYSAYLKPVLHHTLSSHPVWGAVRNIQTLANTMVTIYEQVGYLSLVNLC